MKRKMLVSLLDASQTDGQLDDKKITKIGQFLKKSELRQYIHVLKLFQATHRVTATLAFVNDSMENELRKTFPRKDIVINADTAIGTGIRIIDNDMMIDLTAATRLADVIEMIEKNYN